MHIVMHNLTFKLTESLEIMFSWVYLLIHVIKRGGQNQ